MMNIETVWNRIVSCEGDAFHQIRGKEFTYFVAGNSVKLSTTNRSISKTTSGQALEFVLLPDAILEQHLQAHSYLYAILMDSRIMAGLW